MAGGRRGHVVAAQSQPCLVLIACGIFYVARFIVRSALSAAHPRRDACRNMRLEAFHVSRSHGRAPPPRRATRDARRTQVLPRGRAAGRVPGLLPAGGRVPRAGLRRHLLLQRGDTPSCRCAKGERRALRAGALRDSCGRLACAHRSGGGLIEYAQTQSGRPAVTALALRAAMAVEVPLPRHQTQHSLP